MIRELLRTNRFLSFIIVGIEFFVFIGLALLVEHPAPVEPTGLLDGLLYGSVIGTGWMKAPLCLIVIALSALAMFSLTERANMHLNLSLEPMFWFIGLSMPFVLSDHPLPILIAQLFFILALRKTMLFDGSKATFAIAFDASILLAIASLFNIFFAIGLIIVFLSIATVRTIKWRDIVWITLGFGLPFYIITGVRYVLGYPFISPIDYSSIPSDGSFPISIPLIVFAVISVSLLLLGVWSNFRARNSHNIRKRNVNTIVLTTFILSILIAGLNSVYGYNGMTVNILALPMSLVLIDLFGNGKYPGIYDVITALWLLVGTFAVVSLVVNN